MPHPTRKAKLNFVQSLSSASFPKIQVLFQLLLAEDCRFPKEIDRDFLVLSLSLLIIEKILSWLELDVVKPEEKEEFLPHQELLEGNSQQIQDFFSSSSISSSKSRNSIFNLPPYLLSFFNIFRLRIFVTAYSI